MNYSLCDFRIVTPASKKFSAAELRIGKTTVKFNSLSAAELHYPEYVRLMIGSDGVTLVIQPCDRTEPNAVPFMAGRTADDLNGRKNWVCFNNPMLSAIIHEKTHWEDTTASRRFFAAPWPEENALIFDLTRPVPPRKRILNLSADDILRTYERAAQPMYPVVYGRHTASVVDANFVPVSS